MSVSCCRMSKMVGGNARQLEWTDAATMKTGTDCGSVRFFEFDVTARQVHLSVGKSNIAMTLHQIKY